MILGALAALAAGPALAQDAATRGVVAQLEAQGFRVVETGRTLLGRVRVLARRGNTLRELVFDPRNGAILRDFSYNTDDGEGRGGGSGTQGGPGTGDDDDDDDDNDDDDDDDDGDDDDDD